MSSTTPPGRDDGTVPGDHDGKIPARHDTDGVDEGEEPMDEHEQDEAYRRLRAADPALNAAMDVDRLLAAARLRAGLVVPGPPAAGTDELDGVSDGRPAVSDERNAGEAAAEPDGPSAGTGELAARRRRRSRRWQVAAVLAAFAVVGAGGYGLGSTRTSSGASAGSAGQVQGSADTALAPVAPLGGTVGSEAFGGVQPRGSAPVGARQYVADGLSTDVGTGAVYGLNPVQVSAALVARQAQAWGVSGEPVAQGTGSWTVQDGDGDWLAVAAEGGVLRVDLVLATPRGCADAPCDTPDGARALALTTLAAAGIDTATLTVQVTGQVAGLPGDLPGELTVTARPSVGAGLSPLGWTVQVGPEGVTSISGLSGDPVELGTDALVSPAQAALRLNDTRFDGWALAVAPAVPAPSAAVPGQAAPSAPTAGQATPAVPVPAATAPAAGPSGAGVPWPVTTVRLVQSRLTLALTSGEHPVLVPAYQLTDDTGATYVVPALTDDALEVLDR